MRPIEYTLTMAAADADGICQAQTPAGAGNLTLNGALSGTMDVARRVSILSAADESARTITVTGTDRYGKTISEAIAGGNATTVYGNYNFKTVTQVAIDGAGTGNISVGSMDSCEGAWLPIDRKILHTIQVSLSSAADLTWAIEATATNVLGKDYEHEAKVFTLFGKNLTNNSQEVDAIGGGTVAEAVFKLEQPVCALRVALADFVSGTVTLNVLEGG